MKSCSASHATVTQEVEPGIHSSQGRWFDPQFLQSLSQSVLGPHRLRAHRPPQTQAHERKHGCQQTSRGSAHTAFTQTKLHSHSNMLESVCLLSPIIWVSSSDTGKGKVCSTSVTFISIQSHVSSAVVVNREVGILCVYPALHRCTWGWSLLSDIILILSETFRIINHFHCNHIQSHSLMHFFSEHQYRCNNKQTGWRRSVPLSWTQFHHRVQAVRVQLTDSRSSLQRTLQDPTLPILQAEDKNSSDFESVCF